MITWIFVIIAVSLVILGVSALLSLVRLVLGPTALDRAISIDVVTASVIASIVILIAWWGRGDLAVLLIIFTLTAFFSTVTVSRYVANAAAKKSLSESRRTGEQ